MLRNVINLLANQTRVTVGRFASSTTTGSFSRFDNEDYSITDSDSEGSSSDETNINEIKQKILNASLPFVLQHGWSNKSLALGAEKVSLSGMSHGLFPKGGYELVSHFYKNCNKELEREMKERLADAKSKTNTHQFIEGAVKYRLGLVTPYLPRWPEASVLMCHPYNVADSFLNFSSLIDDIWHHAGDKSSDLNWYSKRAVLGLVYKSTEACLVGDESEDFQETWRFLSRRMDDVDKLRQISEAPAYIGSAFQVAMNLFALNNVKRK